MATAIIGMSAASAVDPDFDLGDRLKERLDIIKQQKEKSMASSNRLGKELQEMFQKIPKKPRESMEVLDDKIKKLEYQRTIVSMPLQEEKKILYEIQGIEKVKKQLAEYTLMEAKIQAKKKEQSDLWETIKANNAAIVELDAAIAKVQLAKKLGCKPTELQNISIDCPAEKVGRIIGRNGATIQQIEHKCRVSIWEKPTLVMVSNRDPVTRGLDRWFYENVPGVSKGKNVVVDGAGHFLQETQGEELAKNIVTFIDNDENRGC